MTEPIQLGVAFPNIRKYTWSAEYTCNKVSNPQMETLNYTIPKILPCPAKLSNIYVHVYGFSIGYNMGI